MADTLSFNSLLGLSFLIAIISLLWWSLPLYQRARVMRGAPPLDRKDVESLEDEYRKTLTQAFSGIFVVATILFAYMQLVESRKSTEAQLASARRNTDIQLMSGQFAKGFDLLGSSTIAQRLGGIHILNNWIMRPLVDDGSTLETRYALIAPAFIAYVRQYTTIPRTVSECEEFERPKSVRITDDIRAALDVIGAWTHTSGHGVIRLDDLNLSGADLSGFDLDRVDLSYSDISGANLTSTKFRGARLYCTNMWGARIDAADFSSPPEGETVLAGALMIRVQSSGTIFARTNLRSANISEARLTRPDFTDADLYNTNFFRSVVADPILTGQTDVSDACFVETTLSGASFSNARGAQSSLFIKPFSKDGQPESHCFLPQRHGLLVPSRR